MSPPADFRAYVIAFFIMAAGPSAASGQTAVLGSWRGTSTCVDRVANPACRDEEVIYDVLALAGSDSVSVKADKIVGTAREFMGEFHFGLSRPDEWQVDFQTPRFHGRWILNVVGDRMTGTLVDVPSGRVVRRVALGRVKS